MTNILETRVTWLNIKKAKLFGVKTLSSILVKHYFKKKRSVDTEATLLHVHGCVTTSTNLEEATPQISVVTTGFEEDIWKGKYKLIQRNKHFPWASGTPWIATNLALSIIS